MDFEIVFFLEFFCSVDVNVDFGFGGNEGNVGIFDFVENVFIFGGFFDRGVFELGEVLMGQCNNVRSVVGGQGYVVVVVGFVIVGWVLDYVVGQGVEVSEGFDRLVSRIVFIQINGVVSGDLDDVFLGEGR